MGTRRNTLWLSALPNGPFCNAMEAVWAGETGRLSMQNGLGSNARLPGASSQATAAVGRNARNGALARPPAEAPSPLNVLYMFNCYPVRKYHK